MKTMKVFDFDDIFRWAGKEYDLHWNTCNDVFFNNSLEYKRHSTIYPADWKAYITFDYLEAKEKASDYTKEEVAAMTDLDKSYVILSAYFENLNVTDSEVLVDCT